MSMVMIFFAYVFLCGVLSFGEAAVDERESTSLCTFGTKITLTGQKSGVCPGIKQAMLTLDDSEQDDGSEKQSFFAMQSSKDFAELVKQLKTMQNVLESIKNQFAEMKTKFERSERSDENENFQADQSGVLTMQNEEREIVISPTIELKTHIERQPSESVARAEKVIKNTVVDRSEQTEGSKTNVEFASEQRIKRNVGKERYNCRSQPCHIVENSRDLVDDVQSKLSKHAVAVFNLDEDVSDSSGNGYHGNKIGAIIFEKDVGVRRGALRLLGNSKINVDKFRLHPWGNGFGVSLWVKRTGNWDSEQVILSNGAAEYGTWDVRMGSQMAGQMIGANIFTCWDPYRRQWTYQDVLAEHNTWHHVVVSFDSTNFDFYLDGTKRQKTVRGGCSSDTPIRDTPLTIAGGGVGSSGQYFMGMIDELIIFNTSLNYNDVKYLYRENSPNECTDIYLVAYFPFDEDFNDHSCHGRHGDKGEGQFIDPSDSITGSAANFGGRSRMEVSLLHGYPWGSQFSVSFWYKRTDNFRKEQTLVWHSTWEIRTGTNSKIAAVLKSKERDSEAGRLVFGQSSTYPYKNVEAADDEWHHVVLTYDGSLLLFYLDGTKQDGEEEGCLGDVVIGDAPLMIGGRVIVQQKSDVPMGLTKRGSRGHDYFTGLIDELKLYRRVLFEEDVQILYTRLYDD